MFAVPVLLARERGDNEAVREDICPRAWLPPVYNMLRSFRSRWSQQRGFLHAPIRGMLSRKHLRFFKFFWFLRDRAHFGDDHPTRSRDSGLDDGGLVNTPPGGRVTSSCCRSLWRTGRLSPENRSVGSRPRLVLYICLISLCSKAHRRGFKSHVAVWIEPERGKVPAAGLAGGIDNRTAVWRKPCFVYLPDLLTQQDLSSWLVR